MVSSWCSRQGPQVLSSVGVFSRGESLLCRGILRHGPLWCCWLSGALLETQTAYVQAYRRTEEYQGGSARRTTEECNRRQRQHLHSPTLTLSRQQVLPAGHAPLLRGEKGSVLASAPPAAPLSCVGPNAGPQQAGPAFLHTQSVCKSRAWESAASAEAAGARHGCLECAG
jgi:hypothetical protein